MKRLAVVAVLLAAVVAIGVAHAMEDRSAPARPIPRAASSMAGASAYGVSYYPSSGGWTLMWERFAPTQIGRDFAAIHAAGARWVRIIVPPDAFGFPAPSALMQARLRQVLDMAGRDKLAVHLSLFDLFGGFDQITQSEQWARALLVPLSDDRTLTDIEVRNELQPTDPAAVTWARALIPYVRGLTHRSVTISLPGTTSPSRLRRFAGQLGRAGQPNYYSIHVYTDEPAEAGVELAEARAAVAPVPIAIGETGFSTAPAAAAPASLPDSAQLLDAFQSVYLRSVALDAQRLRIPLTVWTWSNFTINAIPSQAAADRTPLQYGYGLTTLSGAAKPALGALHAAYSGHLSRTQNFGFEQGDTQTEFPDDWRIGDGTDGRAVWDHTVHHTGRASLRFSRTRGSQHAVPSVYVTPIGQIAPGRRYALSVYARGQQLTGQTYGSISWYNDAGRFLSESDTPRLPQGTTGWTRLSVAGRGPAGTAFARVYVKSADDTGSAWFDDVSFAGG